MTRALPILLLVLAACGEGPDAPASAVSGPAAERIDAYLSRLEAVGFSGSVVVRTPEGTILSKGYGLADDSAGTRYSTGTIATVGSLTKQFTAAAVMLLQAEGRLSVEDPITRFIEGVPPDKAGVTVHALLSHTAGFPGALGDDFVSVGRDEYVAAALAAPLDFPPGEGYAYSNTGYSLLAAIVEIASGMEYGSFLRERLLRPAGMEDTGYWTDGFPEDRLAVGYRDGRRWGRFIDRGTGPVSWHMVGNGGIHSTPEDMMRWDVALRDGKVLPSALVESMVGRYGLDSPAEDVWYGYGWTIWPTPRGTRLVKHNGGNGVFYADFLRFVDEDAAIFLVTNRSTRAASRLGWTLADLLFDPAFESPAPEWVAPDLPDFPDTPQGRVVRDLVELLVRGAPEGLQPFVETRFAPEFRDVVPMDEHLRILGIVQEEMRGRARTRLRGDGFSFAVVLTADDGRPPLTLTVELGGPSPDLVSGIGVE